MELQPHEPQFFYPVRLVLFSMTPLLNVAEADRRDFGKGSGHRC